MKIEGYEIINKSGEVLEFSNQEVSLLNRRGFGSPNASIATVAGVFQDGATINRFKLAPRTLQLEIFVNGDRFRDKIDYWNYRSSLFRFFNLMAAPLTFRVTREDGSSYYLEDVYPTDGLSYDSNGENYSIKETIGLTAYNPVWKSDVINTVTTTTNEVTELMFPITFPIEFQSSDGLEKAVVNYTGSWKAYPTIKISGAYTYAKFTNIATGAYIELFKTTIGTNTRTIVLEPTKLSITNELGQNVIGELTEFSSLGEFYFEPYVENGIYVSLLGTTSGTTFEITYQNTEIGI